MKGVLTLIFLITTTSALHAQLGFFSSNSVKEDTASMTPTSNSLKYIGSASRYLGLSYEGGYILPVDDKKVVNDLFKASTYRVLTVTSSWDVPGSSPYSRIYRKPKLGLGVSLVNFNNPALGKPVTVFGFTEIPVTAPDSRWYASYGIGGGVGFGFNHYDKTTNPGNIAIGSSVNAYLEMDFKAGYWLGRDFLLTLATGYRHYSNGSTKKPNAGINIVPVQLSLKYQTRKIDYHASPSPLPAYRKNFSYAIYTNVGFKQMEENGEMIFKNLTGVNAGYQFSYKYRVAVGFDLNYTSGSAERVKSNASDFSKYFSYGPYLGWEWFFTERIYVPVYLGVYMHRNYENDETNQFFQRLGLRYLLLKNKNLSVGVGLKTHFGQADFVEFGVGYHIRH